MHPVITEYLMDAHAATRRAEADSYRRTRAEGAGPFRLALQRFVASRRRRRERARHHTRGRATGTAAGSTANEYRAAVGKDVRLAGSPR